MDTLTYIDMLIEQVKYSPLFHSPLFPGLDPIYNDLQLLRSKIDKPLHAAVIGEVKAGKSTLINAFAGGKISPTNATETTSCIMKISYSPEETAIIHFTDGHDEEYAIPDMYDILTSHHNDQTFFSQCKDVEIKRNLPGLRHIYLLDTPGLETITTANEARTVEYFQTIDVIIWVFNGNYLGQYDINNRVRQIAMMGKPIIAIINRIDQIEEDAQNLLDYLDDSMGIYLEKIFPLSAQQAYTGVINNNIQLQNDSGFTDLYTYLDEHIDHKVDEVQKASIMSSATVLEKKINLFHRQVLDQIEMKIRTYMDLDEQIQFNGHLLSEKILSNVTNWLQTQFLQEAEINLCNQIDARGLFTGSTAKTIQEQIQQELSQERINHEIDSYLKQLSYTITTDWRGRLSNIDTKLSQMYEKEQEKYELEMLQISQNFTDPTGLDSIKNSVIAASTAGGVLSLYSAAMAPAMAHVTLGASLSSIMPPLMLAGAAVGIVTSYAKGKKVKNYQRQQVQHLIGMIRNKTAQSVLPSLETYLQELCEETKEEAKKDFIEKNFASLTLQELQYIVQQLQKFTSSSTPTLPPVS